VKESDKNTESLIGQFGVGFYSAFMVGDHVQVFSQSVDTENSANSWESDGTGSYTLAAASGVTPGTKIVIKLNDENKQSWSDPTFLEGIIKKYSNFVGFPIYLNGESVNTVQAIWTMDKKSVTEEQHLEFYRFIANAWDKPQMRLQYGADVPLAINALLYVPGTHMEKMGMGRQDPGVSLYSRKVLIQPKSEAILPDWLRFVKGVVDCEDIPLNISRETMQDSSLVRKLNRALSTRAIKWFKDEAKRDEEAYTSFFNEFGGFLKEGICIDSTHRHALVPLLRYESSKGEDVTSFDKYAERMPESQQEMYYITAPNRALAEASPYYEAFKKKDIEVFFVYENIDAYVMDNIREFKDKKVVNVEASNLDMDVGSESSFRISRLDRCSVSVISIDAVCLVDPI
jgi:TNF receptor-associated protein 1